MSPPAGAPPTRLGLAGRPGQRRAVRATAVVLGLLAVALGVRDAVSDDAAAPPDVRQRPPATSAPVDPSGEDEPRPADDGRGAPG